MSRTYAELMSQAAVNLEFFRETIQSTGTAAMTMSVVGTPSFRRVGKTVGLSNRPPTGITSGAVASPIDITGTVTLETAFVQLGTLPPTLLAQNGATGGYTFGSPNAADRVEFYTLNAGGAGARILWTSPWSTSMHARPIHVVMESLAGATSGLVWIDNIPAAVGTAGAGVSANPPASVITALDADARRIGTAVLVRAWQGALDAAEIASLYNVYSTLVVPSKV